jgi:hypothetical protein
MLDNGIIAFCLVLALVLLFNVGMFYAFRSAALHAQLRGMKQGFLKAKNSWKLEQQALAELHQATDRIRDREADGDS